MAAAVRSRFDEKSGKRPDLVLIDGGRSQMNAVVNALTDSDLRRVAFVAAVKPRGKHSSVSHFISDSGSETAYDRYNPAQNMLRLLRDEAHDLANRAHRDLRDMKHNYELASVLPSMTEAERRDILRSAGSIAKVAALSDGELERNYRPQTARKIKRDLGNYRAGNSPPVLPFIVPIRFDDENGGADDLRPILRR